MRDEWAEDFSYSYFRKILETAKKNFDFHLLSKIPSFLKKESLGKPKLVLRHDVDVSLEIALQMAKIEKGMGIRATYMVMINSPLYSLKNRHSRDTLREIMQLGHELGIHFNIKDSQRNGTIGLNAIKATVTLACEQVEKLVDTRVLSVSFHRPIPRFIGGPIIVGGRVNAYAKNLMRWYISDSRGYWREGDPLLKLSKPQKSLLQLLIHPIWWGEKHMSVQDRLQEFFEEETKGRSIRYRNAFSKNLLKMIPAVKRRELLI